MGRGPPRSAEPPPRGSDLFRSGTDRRTKIRLAILGGPGLLVLAAGIWGPHIEGYRAIVAAPDFRWGGFAGLALFAARLWGRFRIAPIVGRVALWLTPIVLFCALVEWTIFLPAVQGEGHTTDLRVAQVMQASDGELSLALDNGADLVAGAHRGAPVFVETGQCLTVQFITGRFGVSWIEFYPIAPRPGPGQPEWAHCFGQRRLEPGAQSR